MIIKILKGFILGLLANLAGTYIYIYLMTDSHFIEAVEAGYKQGFLGGLIGLGAVFNLFLFFFFLTTKLGKFQKKPQFYEARGVLLATVLAALAVLYFEF